jgi:uncharacterized membrane protein YdjX (TVP38/TMEM64 family)
METLEIVGGTVFGIALGAGLAYLLGRHAVRKWMEQEW